MMKCVKNPSKYLLFDDMLMGRLDYPVALKFAGLYNDKTISLENYFQIKHQNLINCLFETQFRLSDAVGG